MTKEEKIRQQEAKASMKQRLEIERKIAREAALEETLAYHAHAIEKILGKEMPKGWKMKVSMEILDGNDKPFCSQEIGPGRIAGQIETPSRFILSELLDKHNVNYHIQNIESHD